MWPEETPEDDDDNDDIDSYHNQRLLRLGKTITLKLIKADRLGIADTVSDLDLSDAGSLTDAESDDESEMHLSGVSPASSSTSLPSHNLGAHKGDAEFQSEVKLSLERAFSEGHSVDDAAVELKTLRMASNVSLGRVREAVISSIVERIRIVENTDTAAAPQQRKEIATVVQRWGDLITRIGGADPVETIFVLQVRFRSLNPSMIWSKPGCRSTVVHHLD